MFLLVNSINRRAGGDGPASASTRPLALVTAAMLHGVPTVDLEPAYSRRSREGASSPAADSLLDPEANSLLRS